MCNAHLNCIEIRKFRAFDLDANMLSFAYFVASTVSLRLSLSVSQCVCVCLCVLGALCMCQEFSFSRCWRRFSGRTHIYLLLICVLPSPVHFVCRFLHLNTFSMANGAADVTFNEIRDRKCIRVHCCFSSSSSLSSSWWWSWSCGSQSPSPSSLTSTSFSRWTCSSRVRFHT